MTDSKYRAPCAIFALRRESKYLLRSINPTCAISDAPCPAWFAGGGLDERSVLIVESGIGKESAIQAIKWVLSGLRLADESYGPDAAYDPFQPYLPTVVIAAGFAGALSKGLSCSDIVIGTEVTTESGQSWRTTWPRPSENSDLAPRAQKYAARFKYGRILTWPNIVFTAAAKQDLGAKYKALAVDMESAWIAQACAAAQIPFGCVRVISDSAETDLPAELGELLKRSQVSWRKAASLVLRKPKLWKEIFRLARRTKSGSFQLARALHFLLGFTRGLGPGQASKGG